jgi:hypothetical protein
MRRARIFCHAETEPAKDWREDTAGRALRTADARNMVFVLVWGVPIEWVCNLVVV